MTMDVELHESRRERTVEMRDQDDSSTRERWVSGYDDMEEDVVDKSRESSKPRGREKSKSNRREDRDHRHRDRERSKASHGSKDSGKESKDEKDRVSGRDRRNEDRDKQEKEKSHDKARERDLERDKYKDKERDKDRKERGKEKERDREHERVKDKNRDKDKDREKEREKEREKHKEQGKERNNDRDRSRNSVEKEKGKERIREKERDVDQDKERQRDKDRGSHKQRDESHERIKDLRKEDKYGSDSGDDQDAVKLGTRLHDSEDGTVALKDQQNADGGDAGSHHSASELGLRIMKMKEERLKKSEVASEVLSWVNRSRKIEESKNADREKALHLSKIFEEQDNMNERESDDEDARQNVAGGVKILHGLDKVLEGGAVVLTLKDQSILADGAVNQEVDVLENVDIGEQKRRDDAYKAAKKKTGIYDDKFNDETGSERKILPQYDDPVADEGITLDANGRISGEVEKKLEELRRRLQGGSKINNAEDLNASSKILSDYYTQEEMLQFKKPKKKKSLRKKDKLDIDALEAEAKSVGLGVGDLGSRSDGRRQALKEEQERNDTEMRSNAYQSALAKAGEASKTLRLGQTRPIEKEEDDTPVFGDDDEDLRKSLERARKLALKIQNEVTSGPQAIALLASSNASHSVADNQNSVSADSQENKVVFTEMEEFVWGLQLDEEAQEPNAEDVFMEEDLAPDATELEPKEDGGWSEVKESREEETPETKEEEIVQDETIHEVAVGKGLSGALKLLKDRGSLKETVEWGGRNMDKKKSKLVGIHDDEGPKEIHIERTDEYGRILTPKEAFRIISHKFHGKGPGKMKQEKRMRQYLEELKVKQMKNSDTPSLSVERMREAQAQLKTPYLVLSGHVKPGQTSDPRSGFATVEKDLPGGLTPMLGDKKVEYFLGRRKPEPGDAASQKKPRT